MIFSVFLKNIIKNNFKKHEPNKHSVIQTYDPFIPKFKSSNKSNSIRYIKPRYAMKMEHLYKNLCLSSKKLISSIFELEEH